ncbi:MAG: 4Fe-4S dicluster domain-containing protein [Pseudomonadota bacterium]
MQIGFYFDQSSCSNCLACAVACKDWHDIPAGPVFWRRVTTLEEGEFPDLEVSFLSASCWHCEDATCISRCPAEAISKRASDGIVTVAGDACLGRDQCGECLEACPYGAPQFGSESDAKMQKCDLCADRWDQGKKPVCVEACPMRALDAGPLEKLKSKYGNGLTAKGFTRHDECRPAVLFKTKG